MIDFEHVFAYWVFFAAFVNIFQGISLTWIETGDIFKFDMLKPKTTEIIVKITATMPIRP